MPARAWGRSEPGLRSLRFVTSTGAVHDRAVSNSACHAMTPNHDSAQDKTSDAGLYLVGVGYGLTLAVCGGTYTTFARHGVLAGLSAYVRTAMRFGIAAVLFLPVLVKWGLRDLGGLGWPRALALTACAGPPFSLLV